eukprot:UN25372
MLWNRSYVIRDQGDGNTDLGLFQHSEGKNELEYLGKVPLKDIDKKSDFKPYKMQTHQSDAKIMYLSEAKPETVSVMDMQKGTVVEEWKPNRGTLKDFSPLTKYEQRTDNSLFKLCTSMGYMTMDPRTKEKVVEEFKMRSNPKFTAMATTGTGQWAIGSEDGSIRMYNKTMRAKTKLPGLGKKIRHIDVTEDGEWILATCRNYLVLINTVMPDSFKMGYDVRMGKSKPKPIKLHLKTKDVVHYGILHVDFTPARFNTGKDEE